MHTAFDLKPEHFSIGIEGRLARWPELFPAWGRHDRFGIVVTEMLGALGANLLIQAAVLAYYESDPARRAMPARYPEIYLFHAGGRFGEYSAYDFWPARKEVFLSADPVRVLEALNDHGITRLAVPDGAPQKAEFPFKEPAAALERIDSAFAYHPSGLVAGADVELRARDPILARYVERTLTPEISLERARAMPTADDPVRVRDRARWIAHVEARRDEATLVQREAARRRFQAAAEDGLPRETLRRLEPEAALDLLVAHPCCLVAV
ncbi:hypothetical protein ACFOD4_21235 [Pseudoroseomonas globiformis]|uniref:Uncharacterized protein n=1 Tax=Teichococcus globiformis TaxID=2307229 RepID=A0ABV7G7U7_9PROT